MPVFYNGHIEIIFTYKFMLVKRDEIPLFSCLKEERLWLKEDGF